MANYHIYHLVMAPLLIIFSFFPLTYLALHLFFGGIYSGTAVVFVFVFVLIFMDSLSL